MAKTLAENDANIKAKKQAAKQQVGSTALTGLVANQSVLCLHHVTGCDTSQVYSACSDIASRDLLPDPLHLVYTRFWSNSLVPPELVWR